MFNNSIIHIRQTQVKQGQTCTGMSVVLEEQLCTLSVHI